GVRDRRDEKDSRGHEPGHGTPGMNQPPRNERVAQETRRARVGGNDITNCHGMSQVSSASSASPIVRTPISSHGLRDAASSGAGASRAAPEGAAVRRVSRSMFAS